MKKEDFKNVIIDITKKIDELHYEDKDKLILRYLIETLIIKFCESEEVMNDNFRILDQFTRKRIK